MWANEVISGTESPIKGVTFKSPALSVHRYVGFKTAASTVSDRELDTDFAWYLHPSSGDRAFTGGDYSASTHSSYYGTYPTADTVWQIRITSSGSLEWIKDGVTHHTISNPTFPLHLVVAVFNAADPVITELRYLT